VLGVVVVPRNSIIAKECEKLVRVAFEASFVAYCNFGLVVAPGEIVIKAVYRIFVPPQVV
jgi:hypothetical protein